MGGVFLSTHSVWFVSKVFEVEGKWEVESSFFHVFLV